MAWGYDNPTSENAKRVKEELEAKEARDAAADSTLSATNDSEPESDFTESETESYQETVQQEAVQSVESLSGAYQDYLVGGAVGFLIGAFSVFFYFRMKIKKIKAECNTKVNEARETIDRIISVMAKE